MKGWLGLLATVSGEQGKKRTMGICGFKIVINFGFVDWIVIGIL